MRGEAAFTLAEVLITLGIIGVVSAITMPVLVTNMQNKGYVERMKKAYSLIQNVTTQIVNEDGAPTNWVISTCDTNEYNQNIVELYSKKLKVVKKCDMSFWHETECNLEQNGYKTLSGKTPSQFKSLFYYSYPVILSDNVTIAFSFRSNANGGCFGKDIPDITFIVDVNSKQKPNKIGRDIFYFYLDKNENGKIYPYGYAQEDDCNKDGEGYTGAQKIITEGKMNY